MSLIYSLYANLKLFLYLFFYNKIFNNHKLLNFFQEKIYIKALYEEIKIRNITPKFFYVESFEHHFELMENINNFPKNPNSYENKNINTYQSNHDIHHHALFKNFASYLENYLNQNILPHYNISNYKFKINKMWFVISSQNGKINPHNHIDGHISGVLYPDSHWIKGNGLTIYNPFKIIKRLEYNNEKFINEMELSSIICKESSDTNTMIIFDSFLMHSVNKVKLKSETLKRVSIAWDAKLIKF